MTTTHHLRTLTHGLHALAVLLLAALWLAACSRPKAEVPAHSRPVSEAPHTFPDCRDVVIPPNIAPLNMQVKNAGTAFVANISAGSHSITAAAGADGVLQFDSLQWRTLLTQTRGHDLRVSLYAQREGEWVSLPAYTMHVAEEEIDRYLSYRLIEPSYEIYRQLGLYQRDLEGFGVRTIYENNRRYESDHNHCINCHNYQNHSTRRMLFHVRGKHGGTVFVENGKAVKMNMKSDSLLASAVYPTWHPQHNWVVFSSNQTGQAFHLRNPQKIEVIDYGSDLIFYDAERHTVCNVLKTDADLETFPCWAPDGRKLYYCSAHVPQFEGLNTDQRRDLVTNLYAQLHYNVMSMTFDPATRTWGAPQVEVDCAAMGRSDLAFITVGRNTESRARNTVSSGAVMAHSACRRRSRSAAMPAISGSRAMGHCHQYRGPADNAPTMRMFSSAWRPMPSSDVGTAPHLSATNTADSTMPIAAIVAA